MYDIFLMNVQGLFSIISPTIPFIAATVAVEGGCRIFQIFQDYVGKRPWDHEIKDIIIKKAAVYLNVGTVAICGAALLRMGSLLGVPFLAKAFLYYRLFRSAFKVLMALQQSFYKSTSPLSPAQQISETPSRPLSADESRIIMQLMSKHSYENPIELFKLIRRFCVNKKLCDTYRKEQAKIIDEHFHIQSKAFISNLEHLLEFARIMKVRKLHVENLNSDVFKKPSDELPDLTHLKIASLISEKPFLQGQEIVLHSISSQMGLIYLNSFKRLEHLEISTTELDFSYLSPSLGNLKFLDVFAKQTITGISALSLYPQLETLKLTYKEGLTQSNLEDIAKCRNLKHLKLSSMNHLHVLPKEGLVAMANGLQNLHTLSLRRCYIEPEGLPSFFQLKKLQKLTLIDAEWVTVESLDNIGKNFPDLKTFTISYIPRPDNGNHGLLPTQDDMSSFHRKYPDLTLNYRLPWA